MDDFFFSIPLRKSKRVDLKRALELFINSNYDLGVYNAHRDAINELDALRRACIECDIAKNNDGLSYLSTYLMQLFDLIPKLSDGNHRFSCEFLWYNSIEKGSLNLKPVKHVNSNISYEVANVFMMFFSTIWHKACQRNIFSDNEELKQAKNEFLTLSGMSHYLLEYVKSHELGETLSDLSPPFIATLNLLALTHAQECLFIKAHLDKMTDLLLAKITKQIFIHYGTCKGLIKNYKSSATVIKELCKYFDAKQHFYKSLFNYYQGCDDLANRKYNDYLARMKNAFDTLNLSDITKKAANVPFLRNLESKIRADYNTAMEDNRCIYSTIPTPSESLSDVEPTSIVKTPQFVPDMLQQYITHDKYTDLFQFLHSITISKLIIHFNNTRESFVSSKLSIVEDGDKKLEAKLIEYNLPACIESRDKNELPPSIKTKSVEFKEYGGIDTILERVRTIKEIKRLYKDVVQCIKVTLAEEKAQDDNFRMNVPDCYHISPSRVGSETYHENYNYIVEKIDQAANADATLDSNLEQLKTKCHILSNPYNSPMQSVSSLSSLDSKSISSAEQRELQRIYDLLVSNREERNKSVQMYCSKEDRSDQMLKMIKERPKEDTSLWPNEIINTEYADVNIQLEENLQAQASIIRQLDNYITSIGLKPRLHNKDHALCQEVCQIYNIFLEVNRHINQGRYFHDQIKDLALKLQDQVNDFVKSRNIEKNLYMEQRAANKPSLDRSFNRSFNSGYEANAPNSSSGSLNSSFYGAASTSMNQPSHPNVEYAAANHPRYHQNSSFDTSTTISSQYPSSYANMHNQPYIQSGTTMNHPPPHMKPNTIQEPSAPNISSYYSRPNNAAVAASKYPPQPSYGVQPSYVVQTPAVHGGPPNANGNNVARIPPPQSHSHHGAAPYTNLPAYGARPSQYPPTSEPMYGARPYNYSGGGHPGSVPMNNPTHPVYPYNNPPRPYPPQPASNAPRNRYYPPYNNSSHYIPPRY